jgi:hypothetical protein
MLPAGSISKPRDMAANWLSLRYSDDTISSTKRPASRSQALPVVVTVRKGTAVVWRRNGAQLRAVDLRLGARVGVAVATWHGARFGVDTAGERSPWLGQPPDAAIALARAP